MRLLLFLALAFRLFAKTPFEDTFPSSAEEIASLKNHLLIEGYVSPLSGQLVITESDLVVKGASDSFGFSNLRGEEPDSRVDLRNITLEFSGSQLVACWPDGTKRLYSKWNHLYRLDKEITPNSQAVRYEYDNYTLKKIIACDVSEK
ncbi:MAG: hypothetical protein KGI80_05400 [Verrucomicrobiota bacterium]|nr:hypothetical protein [Verrucomicrobiota bacterium]